MNLKLNTMKALFLSTIFIASFILFQSCSDNQSPTGLQNITKNGVVHRGATSSNDEKPNTCIPCMDNITIHVQIDLSTPIDDVQVTLTSQGGVFAQATTNTNGDAIFNWYNKGWGADNYAATAASGGIPCCQGGYVPFYWDGQSIIEETINTVACP